ncbi:MAG: branched-chain amino acid aminotransferase [Parasphingorhabdus sp.]|jgi:branched-chain amino acid aminotransferase
MTKSIETQKIAASRIHEIDFDHLSFGNQYSDHMFQMDFDHGQWSNPRILPYGPFSIEPGALGLHYGQSVFEGLKAFKGKDGKARIFRADRNANRLINSCQRLCIPTIDEELFLQAIDALIKVDSQWIPGQQGHALYIRPLIIATEAHLNVKASERYSFFIMTSPVNAVFGDNPKPISLKAERRYTRAAAGGMGNAKTAGNYAASLYPANESIAAGHNQVLWLDGKDHTHIEECGQMNIFFKINGTVITPDLQGTILPGITRESVIQLLKDLNIPCQQRRISIDEIVEASSNGQLEEVFGAGTAAVIAPVGRIEIDNQLIEINQGKTGELSAQLYQHLVGIQMGDLPDIHSWNRLVNI